MNTNTNTIVNTAQELSFTRCPSVTNHQGEPFNPTWADFCASLGTPLELRAKADKIKLSCVALGTFKDNYVNANNAQSISALGLDIEVSKAQPGIYPPSFAEASDALQDMGISLCAYTTVNHADDKPRYRVIFPLDGTIEPRLAPYAYRILWLSLPEILQPFVDHSCNSAERLFILPAYQPRAAYWSVDSGDYGSPLAANALSRASLVLEAQSRHLAEKRAQRANMGPLRGNSIIAEFNRRVSVTEMLEAAGYIRKGHKFLSPSSTSGLPGVSLLEDGKAYSHHADDPLNTGHAHDSFSIFATIYHNGDATKAAAALYQEVAA